LKSNNLLEKGWAKITTDGEKSSSEAGWTKNNPDSIIFFCQNFPPIGCNFWSNLFLKGCVLVQPF